MKKFKKILFFSVIFSFCGLLVYLLILPNFIQAQQDDVNLHIKLEGSKDNGATWHNYSGTEYSGKETINAEPGETILLRVKIWNTGTQAASTVVSTGILTNYDYVSQIVLENDNLDGNARSFVLGDEMASATISQVADNGTETCTPVSGSECASLNLILSDNFPVGQTIITSKVYIDSYLLLANSFLDKLVREAYAEGVGRESLVRIAVDIPEPAPVELPQTGVEIK